jgi:hypothetical protein
MEHVVSSDFSPQMTMRMTRQIFGGECYREYSFDVRVYPGKGWALFGLDLAGNGSYTTPTECRDDLIDRLAAIIRSHCEGCGAALRRCEGNGLCSDCDETRRVADIDDNEHEAAREAARPFAAAKTLACAPTAMRSGGCP